VADGIQLVLRQPQVLKAGQQPPHITRTNRLQTSYYIRW